MTSSSGRWLLSLFYLSLPPSPLPLHLHLKVYLKHTRIAPLNQADTTRPYMRQRPTTPPLYTGALTHSTVDTTSAPALVPF
mmetsp:Transcript_7552/g.19563  ORF Transcript_7552/g.19563 Transcript_7552/m.19563 type:complete len:81 (+) Transcript_7552:626-868(+)